MEDSDSESDCILEMDDNGIFQPQQMCDYNDIESITSNFVLEFTDDPYIKKYKDSYYNDIIESTNKLTKNRSPSFKINRQESNNINRINFDLFSIDKKETLFYNIEILNTLNFIDIYNILINTYYIIFVDNDKLIKTNKINCMKKKIHLFDLDFHECTFFPIESIDYIKKNIYKLNNSILNAEYKNKFIYNDEDICCGILFDNNDIIKHTLYKKMDIKNMFMFIPIDKYNLKQTEYKIRGFCQIVEELGAKTINIIFQKNNITEDKKVIKTKISSDIEIIAGNLGLSRSSTSSTSENHSYSLSYPINNTISLSENIIKDKIKNKYYITSESSYNSNLELQYLVHSRCNHLIDRYSTIFTFDNNNILDRSIFVNLKSYGIDLNINYKEYSMNKNSISIITNVIFSSLDDYKDIINGNSVSMDSIGFGFLMNCLHDSDDFNTNGIYKIIVFINSYIDTVVKNNNTIEYNTIHNIIKKIKIQLTLIEYAELLCNSPLPYFTKNSQWIHFINYLDILSNKTRSYDKLGYIIIINNTNISVDKKIEIMLNFIQQISIDNKIEDKFWQMIQPNNIKLKNELKYKLLYEYDFVQYYNWYNFNMLIRCITLYTVNFNNMDDTVHLQSLITNMNVGYKYWEFYNNIVPFIIKYTHLIYNTVKDDIYLNKIFQKSINVENFIVAKINTIDDLKDFICNNIKNIKQSYEFVKTLEYPLTLDSLYQTIISSEFIDKYNYLNQKINIILGNKTFDKLKEWITVDIIKDENTMLFYINKLIVYNEKLNSNNIISNYLGFEIVYKNYISGIKKKEFNKLIKPFIINLIQDTKISQIVLNNICIDNFNILSYYDLCHYIENIMIQSNIDSNKFKQQLIIS